MGEETADGFHKHEKCGQGEGPGQHTSALTLAMMVIVGVLLAVTMGIMTVIAVITAMRVWMVGRLHGPAA